MTSTLTPTPGGGRSTAVGEFLDKLRQRSAAPATPGGRGRLIFALDATASREPTWDHACRLQGEMFDATASCGGLNIQLVFYRGYSECKASRWLTSASELHAAMRQVSCSGGETQIERVLTHALRAAADGPMGALVFVGDAMEEDPDRLCRLAGDLGRLGVPLFVFHETDPADIYPSGIAAAFMRDTPGLAARTFRQMADLTRGAYLVFDTTSAERLRILLGAVALFATGNQAALTAYGTKHGGEVLRLTHTLNRTQGG
jgi:hypothetical protein